MAGFREKITPFTFGLSVGLLTACLFFIFKLDDYLKKIDFTAISLKGKATEEVVKSDGLKKEITETEVKKTTGTHNTTKKNQAIEKDAGSSILSTDNINDSSYYSTETYKVLKEELQSVKNLYVKVLN